MQLCLCIIVLPPNFIFYEMKPHKKIPFPQAGLQKIVESRNPGLENMENMRRLGSAALTIRSPAVYLLYNNLSNMI